MNIEKTISEQAVSDILTPMLESQDRIVTEDVAPLFDQATGLDTPTASGSVTTTIEESRSVITAIIRKAWTATLTMLGGASVLSSIAAAYTYLRTRLQGNETYGIPDRRSEISASSPLAANLALLNDRKMVGGIGEEDGLSLAQALCGSYADVTALTDSNYGWTMGRANFIATLVSLFPNLKDITLNCVEAPQLISNPAIDIHPLNLPYLEHTTTPQHVFINGMEEWYLPKIKSFDQMNATAAQTANLKKMNFPDLESIGEGISYPDFFYQTSFPNLEEMYFPSLKYIHTWGTARSIDVAGETTKFWKLVLGKLEYLNAWSGGVWKVDIIQPADTHLVHVEIGAGTAISFSLANWNPTYALQNQLSQFLQNFRSYIANRLTDNGSGKTLTLSQSVFSEIWDSQGQPQVKGDGLDTLRADIHRIIRTDKQWAVNKA